MLLLIGGDFHVGAAILIDSACVHAEMATLIDGADAHAKMESGGNETPHRIFHMTVHETNEATFVDR
ncbi:unnamed protein product [Clonostachys rosea f. rosea IK726]|uniref:Uncharacterized protein n=1 Tax=Clonostachys rosea f. rosea IK726 TaxID=1349383 RepID=A0ACA9TIH2_BIOOC|nr:unnamed protein product [Clonostachys rosea f. rosea IK726]